MKTILLLIFSALAAQSANAATIICDDCGDPKTDYRNYGAAVYNMFLGAGSDSWGSTWSRYSIGTVSPVIVANPVANTHAEVLIRRDWWFETMIGFPFLLMDHEWEVIVQAPDGSNTTYTILVGTNQLFVDPVTPAEVEIEEQDPQQDTSSSERAGSYGGSGSAPNLGPVYEWRFYQPWGVFPGGGSYGVPNVTVHEMRRFSE